MTIDDLDRLPYQNSLTPDSDPEWRVKLLERRYPDSHTLWWITVWVPSENWALNVSAVNVTEAWSGMTQALDSKKHFLNGVPESVRVAINTLVQDAYDKGAPLSHPVSHLGDIFYNLTHLRAPDGFGGPGPLDIPYRVLSLDTPAEDFKDQGSVFYAYPEPWNLRGLVETIARSRSFSQEWPAAPISLKGPGFPNARGPSVKMEWYLPNRDTITGHPRLKTETEAWQIAHWWTTVARWGMISEAAYGNPSTRGQSLATKYYQLRYTTSCDGHRVVHRTLNREGHEVIFGLVRGLEDIATHIGKDYVENHRGFEEQDEVEFRVYTEASPLVFMEVVVRVVRKIGYESALTEGGMP